MAIPGIAPLSGQPTVTNPLSQESQLVGQESHALQGSETQNTVTAREQESTSVTTTETVNQGNEADQAAFNPDNPGGTIDFTV
jgi:hypothetical protein